MRTTRNITWFVVLALAALALFFADIFFGPEKIGFSDVWNAITGNDSGPYARIVMKYRLPKALVAVAAGAALSASGLQMQTLFRNPLAGPFVLGISSGASLGVALFLMGIPVFGMGVLGETVRDIGMAGAAWIGSAAILLVIMAVSARIKDIMVILILGMMFGSAAGALVEILQYFSPEAEVKSFVVWTMGSLGDVSSRQLGILIPVVGVGLIISILLIKSLNLLLLGENYARTMGVNVKLVRGMIFLSTTLLAGTVTAFCGPIGFIGVAIPHVARMIFGEADHRVLMPASMLAGIVVLLLCDVIRQSVELPINTITALAGIPVIIIVIIRNRRIF